MVAAAMLSSLAALLVVYLFMPALWLSFLNDDPFDYHDHGRTLVASRNPFRETGPPANMAKVRLVPIRAARVGAYSARASAHATPLSLTLPHTSAPRMPPPVDAYLILTSDDTPHPRAPMLGLYITLGIQQGFRVHRRLPPS
ncbi:hypothetical protein EV121DRAFT_280410 [Schizophyllum commune]